MTDAEPKRPRGRPPTGTTPLRTLRAGRIWDDAAALAKQRKESMSALVIRAIELEVQRLKAHEARTN